MHFQMATLHCSRAPSRSVLKGLPRLVPYPNPKQPFGIQIKIKIDFIIRSRMKPEMTLKQVLIARPTNTLLGAARTGCSVRIASSQDLPEPWKLNTDLIFQWHWNLPQLLGCSLIVFYWIILAWETLSGVLPPNMIQNVLKLSRDRTRGNKRKSTPAWLRNRTVSTKKIRFGFPNILSSPFPKQPKKSTPKADGLQ